MIGFSFEDDGFSIETFIEQDLVWCEVFETDISKDESVVDVSNTFDEQVVVGKNLFEVDGPDLFTDGDYH